MDSAMWVLPWATPGRVSRRFIIRSEKVARSGATMRSRWSASPLMAKHSSSLAPMEDHGRLCDR